MAAAIDPFVIRSQRNQERDAVEEEGRLEKLTTTHGSINTHTQSHMSIVEEKHHLGYFSTGYFQVSTV